MSILMTISVHERIKELGLGKANKAGGRRNLKKKSRVNLEQKLTTMIQEGKHIPKHLAKKAKEIIKSAEMTNVNTTATNIEELPVFDEQIPPLNDFRVGDIENTTNTETIENNDNDTIDEIVVL